LECEEWGLLAAAYLPFSSVALVPARADLFQAQLAVILLDDPVALAGSVFKFLAVHDLQSGKWDR
jgi:hypothetical protein